MFVSVFLLPSERESKQESAALQWPCLFVTIRITENKGSGCILFCFAVLVFPLAISVYMENKILVKHKIEYEVKITICFERMWDSTKYPVT